MLHMLSAILGYTSPMFSLFQPGRFEGKESKLTTRTIELSPFTWVSIDPSLPISMSFSLRPWLSTYLFYPIYLILSYSIYFILPTN